MASLTNLLSQCLSTSPEIIKNAEATLNTNFVGKVGFFPELLKIIASSDLSFEPRLIGAILLKNQIKKTWDAPDETQIFQNDKESVKSQIVEIILRISEEKRLKLQLIAALQEICISDFPSHWPDLITNIVKNYLVNCGEDPSRISCCLEMIDVAILQFRSSERTNESLSAIKFNIIPELEKTLPNFLIGSCVQAVSQPIWLPVAEASTSILLSLISIDLPEFIEDALPSLIPALLPLVQQSGEEFERLRNEICELLSIFVKKYCEEFIPYMEDSFRSLSQLVVEPNTSDSLARSALGFLSYALRPRWESDPFSNKVGEICERIVLPNIQLRPSDMELIEESPLEFTRYSLEGFEGMSRRGGAIELVNALNQNYQERVSVVLTGYVNKMITLSSTASQLEKEMIVDALVNLLIAVLVKTESRALGVTRLHPSTINISTFFKTYLMVYITTENPLMVIARYSALKYLSVFSNQFSKDELLSLIIPVRNCLHHRNSVVASHASYCLESILNSRDIPDDASIQTITQIVGTLKIQPALCLAALIETLESLGKLLQSDLTNNEYFMRLLHKILTYLDTSVPVSHLTVLCGLLRNVLERQRLNPSISPAFNHWLFESIAVLAKIYGKLGSCTQVEEAFLPTLGCLLGSENEFSPYSLQILGLMVDVTKSVSADYLQLYNMVLQQEQWVSSSANVPGLVRVISAFFRKFNLLSNSVMASADTLLDRIDYCIQHKRLTTTGFELITQFISQLPWSTVVKPNCRRLTLVLLKRLQASKTDQLCQSVTGIFSLMECKNNGENGGGFVPKLLDEIQSGLAVDFVSNVYLPRAQQFKGLYGRKLRLLSICYMCPTLPTLTKQSIKSMGLLSGSIHDSRLSSKLPTVEIATEVIQEFQGNFNVLQSAKCPAASCNNEIPEVSQDSLTNAMTAVLAHLSGSTLVDDPESIVLMKSILL